MESYTLQDLEYAIIEAEEAAAYMLDGPDETEEDRYADQESHNCYGDTGDEWPSDEYFDDFVQDMDAEWIAESFMEDDE
jgi:hypothetical protein